MAEDQPELLGIEGLKETISISDGINVDRAQLLEAARQESGFTAEEWNQLEEGDRAEAIEKTIAALKAEAERQQAERQQAEKDATAQPAETEKQETETATQEEAAEDEEAASEEEAADEEDEMAEGDDLLDRPSPIRDTLRSYVRNMAPNVPNNPKNGAKYQLQLFNVMRRILATEGSEFNALMSQFLGFIEKYRTTVFSEAQAFRFMDQVNLSSNDRHTFERLLYLCLIGANRQGRQKAVEQVDLNSVLKFINNETARQNVEAFFTGGV